jgi:hypothetical protein
MQVIRRWVFMIAPPLQTTRLVRLSPTALTDLLVLVHGLDSTRIDMARHANDEFVRSNLRFELD